MAESFSHKFGQIIGDLLELALEPRLQKFAIKNKLFLDKKRKRPARKGKKLSWTDGNGNSHDLDFVLERGGTNEKTGIPVAFIETAWRRYTKHSRNKAQEIQGAILPLVEKYKKHSPFIGVVLAGVFTKGAITQLSSSGFCILYFPYNTAVKAFHGFGIDADFNESTSEKEFKKKTNKWVNLPNKQDVARELLRLNKKGVAALFNSLEKSTSRFIERVVIFPLHGQESAVNSVMEAIDFLKKYLENNQNVPVAKYEIIIRYNTGDRIEASFKDKKDTISFLETYL